MRFYVVEVGISVCLDGGRMIVHDVWTFLGPRVIMCAYMSCAR